MSELVSLLLAYGADPNLIADLRRCPAPLTAAVIEGHEDLVQILVHVTANIHRARALAFAVAQRSRRITEALLRNGAPPQFCVPEIPRTWNDHEEWVQPLLLAVQSGNLQLKELLLDFDADINVHCSEFPHGGLSKIYYQVIFWAVEAAHEAMVHLLLERGADPEMTDMAGRPPLSYAVEYEQETIVRSLLDHGANPHRAVVFKGRKLVSHRQMKRSIRTQLQDAEEKWTGSVNLVL
ncbi:hypothetical protein HFD88_003332 [Aspergillus terreus]|nr:hypothetical protein HFD88_003332 [Aspergillus terreus]